MKKTLVRWKIYTDRARWYMGYIQMIVSLMILLQVKGIEVELWYLPFIFIFIVAGFIVVGYFEVRFGTLKEEQKKYAEENPVLQDILKEIRELK